MPAIGARKTEYPDNFGCYGHIILSVFSLEEIAMGISSMENWNYIALGTDLYHLSLQGHGKSSSLYYHPNFALE